MNQIGIYNARDVDGLQALIESIDCDLDPNEQFLIVVMNEEIFADEGLQEAMLNAVSKGAKIIVIWPLEGQALPLPTPLLQLRHALIRFDAEALHDVICGKIARHDGPGAGQFTSADTERHRC